MGYWKSPNKTTLSTVHLECHNKLNEFSGSCGDWSGGPLGPAWCWSPVFSLFSHSVKLCFNQPAGCLSSGGYGQVLISKCSPDGNITLWGSAGSIEWQPCRKAVLNLLPKKVTFSLSKTGSLWHCSVLIISSSLKWMQPGWQKKWNQTYCVPGRLISDTIILRIFRDLEAVLP